MRVLVCIPHYYKHTDGNIMGSASDPLDWRVRYVLQTLSSISVLLVDSDLSMGTSGPIANDIVRLRAKSSRGDIILCVSGNDHLVDRITSETVAKVRQGKGGPRLLGYECRAAFAEHANDYDLFCFIEDDTAIQDPYFFEKAQAFYAKFGQQRVLLPNRYEIYGQRDGAWRVLLDRPLPASYQITPAIDDDPVLTMTDFRGDVLLEKTANVMAGCYVITASQLKYWMQQPGFSKPSERRTMDRMEAAQVPLDGALPVYKPAPEHAMFFAVHHLPGRACRARTPIEKINELLSPEVACRQKRRL